MIVTAVLLVLLVVAAVFAVREFREHQRLQAADDDRSNALNTAQQFALRMDTFKGDHLDDYESSVNAMLTTRAKGEFKQSFPAFEKVYQQGKAVGTGELHAAGIEDIDQDSATVLVIHDRDGQEHLRRPEAVPALVGAAGQGRRRLEDRQVRGRFVMASVTWYDLLGVERDATPEQIRVAWREATDRAEPGTSQFKKYNEAAEVLLDARARSAYDAELAASEPAAGAGSRRAGAGAGPRRPSRPPSRRPTTEHDVRRAPLGGGPLASTGVTVAVALADGPGGRRRRLLRVPEPPARRAGRRRAGGLGRRRAGAAVRALLRLPPAPGRQGAGGALPESRSTRRSTPPPSTS